MRCVDVLVINGRATNDPVSTAIGLQVVERAEQPRQIVRVGEQARPVQDPLACARESDRMS